MTGRASLKEKYCELLKRHVVASDEAWLVAIANLGQEAVRAEIPPETIAEFQGDALLRLADERPELTLREAAPLLSSPLVELLMAYGLAFRQQQEERTAREVGEARTYHQLFVGSQAIQLLIDPQSGTVIDANPTAQQFYGWDQGASVERNIHDLTTAMPDGGADPLCPTGEGAHAVDRHRVATGEIRDMEIYASSVTVGGRRLVSWTLHDITDRLQAEETIRNLAQKDFLTGLPNRGHFHERLDAAISMAQRLNRFVALLVLDLDGFKEVNDTYGHPAGDALLREVAKQLEATVRQTDVVARLGGDEFAIILANLETETTVNTLAMRIIERLSQPFTVDGCLVNTGTSIGVSLYPYDDADPDELIRKADHALYQAKAAGRSTYRMFDEDMQSAARAQRILEGDMRLALVRDEFVIHYQPQLSIPERRIIGAEALIRWRHPARGLIPPGEFIPVAELSDLVVDIGQWVLRTSCAQNKAWQDAGLPHFRIAVNISARQFHGEDLIPTVIATLEETGLEAEWLELEITETIVLADVDRIVDKLRTLNDLGVQLALDDFGTGYSSLAYLKRFPVQRLKIDQSFVRELTTEPDDAAIAEAIIHLGRSLHLNVIAEGAETEAHVAFLSGKGCTEAQGFLFSRPLPADELAAWLMHSRCRKAI